jgi:type I restriction enzyme S subunit
MEGVLENIIRELQIDKGDWTLKKFGDVAIQQKESNPDLNKYVKGEHMGSEDLHLREWGDLKDEYLGPAFIRRFDKGDILYGSRRTYLRKVVIAPFSGITSNTTFVIKANEAQIDKRLLPFIMMSEGFTENSVRNSKGSVNPYINWKDIANYEFFLPPKDQQAQLAELLWVMDEVIEKEREVLKNVDHTYQTLADNLFSKKNEEWDFVPLSEISSINRESLKAKTDSNYTFQYLDLASIEGPRRIGELKTIKFGEAPSRARRIVDDHSIVLALVRPYQKAFVYIERGDNIIASTGTAVINVNDEYEKRFIFHQFFSKRFTQYCEDRMTGTNYPAITPKDVEEFKVIMPKDSNLIPKETKRLDKLEIATFALKSKIESSKSLQKSLINQIF